MTGRPDFLLRRTDIGASCLSGQRSCPSVPNAGSAGDGAWPMRWIPRQMEQAQRVGVQPLSFGSAFVPRPRMRPSGAHASAMNDLEHGDAHPYLSNTGLLCINIDIHINYPPRIRALRDRTRGVPGAASSLPPPLRESFGGLDQVGPTECRARPPTGPLSVRSLRVRRAARSGDPRPRAPGRCTRPPRQRPAPAAPPRRRWQPRLPPGRPARHRPCAA